MLDLKDFSETGRAWLRGAVASKDIESLKSSLPVSENPGARIAPSDALFHAVSKLPVLDQIASHWPGMRLVRMVGFNKSAAANWGVSWHQDRVIAVKAKADVPGFEQWSFKGGAWHCVPPLDVLRKMLFVRLHLDRNTADNGAMQICLGSHKAGFVRKEEAGKVVETREVETPCAEPGDVLVLNMLTLHRSSSARRPSQRAALRLDFASGGLPVPLSWAV